MPNSANSKRRSNGDLNPDTWGPAFWFVMYTTSGNYAAGSGGDRATENDMVKFKSFVGAITENLPCAASRLNIGGHIVTALNELGFSSFDGITDRETAVLFVHTLHVVVNKKLNKSLNFTVDDVRSLIESFRLGDTFNVDTPPNTNGVRMELPLLRVKLVMEGRRVKNHEIPLARDKFRQWSNNPKNGLYPRVWGPVFWFVIYAVAASYVKRDGGTADDSDKIRFMNFLHGMMINLPCKGCRSNYKGAMKRSFSNLDQHGDLRIRSFKDRESLLKFIYMLHSSVSEDIHTRRAGLEWLGMDFTLDDVFKNATRMVDSDHHLSLHVVPPFTGSSFLNDKDRDYGDDVR
jgi:hypothetical protein